jgi:hypothetical protein
MYKYERVREREIDFKEVVHMIVGTRQFQKFWTSQQHENSGKGQCCNLESEFGIQAVSTWQS